MWLAAALVTGRLFATVDVAAPYPVELLYDLEPAAASRKVELTVLEARGAVIANLRFNGAPVVLDRSRSPQLRGEITIPPGIGVVTFRYQAAGSTIPVVVLRLPGEPRFEASLRLPAGLHLVESFPTGVAPDGEGHALDLPIVPAFLSLTLRTRRPLVTLPWLLDGLALVALGGLAVFAIRRRA